MIQLGIVGKSVGFRKKLEVLVGHTQFLYQWPGRRVESPGLPSGLPPGLPPALPPGLPPRLPPGLSPGCASRFCLLVLSPALVGFATFHTGRWAQVHSGSSS